MAYRRNQRPEYTLETALDAILSSREEEIVVGHLKLQRTKKGGCNIASSSGDASPLRVAMATFEQVVELVAGRDAELRVRVFVSAMLEDFETPQRFDFESAAKFRQWLRTARGRAADHTVGKRWSLYVGPLRVRIVSYPVSAMLTGSPPALLLIKGRIIL